MASFVRIRERLKALAHFGESKELIVVAALRFFSSRSTEAGITGDWIESTLYYDQSTIPYLH